MAPASRPRSRAASRIKVSRFRSIPHFTVCPLTFRGVSETRFPGNPRAPYIRLMANLSYRVVVYPERPNLQVSVLPTSVDTEKKTSELGSA